jgi:hypothetical protein
VLTVSDLTRARLPKVGRYFTRKIRVSDFLLVRIPDPVRMRICLFLTKLTKLQLEKNSYNKFFFFGHREKLFEPFTESICVSENEIATVLLLWVIFAYLDPDPDDPLALLNPDLYLSIFLRIAWTYFLQL